jgi:hypothetical protein
MVVVRMILPGYIKATPITLPLISLEQPKCYRSLPAFFSALPSLQLYRA